MLFIVVRCWLLLIIISCCISVEARDCLCSYCSCVVVLLLFCWNCSCVLSVLVFLCFLFCWSCGWLPLARQKLRPSQRSSRCQQRRPLWHGTFSFVCFVLFFTIGFMLLFCWFGLFSNKEIKEKLPRDSRDTWCTFAWWLDLFWSHLMFLVCRCGGCSVVASLLFSHTCSRCCRQDVRDFFVSIT